MTPIRTVICLLVGVGGMAGAPAPVGAQQGSQDRSRREQLQRQIEQQFMARATQDMALDAEQAEQLRSTAMQYAVERRGLERDEQAIKRALSGQLRPGVAAEQDSLVVLLGALQDVREAYIQSFRNELAEMEAFLDPVQRAQYVMLREELIEQIQRVRYSRRQGQPAGEQPQNF